MNLSPSPRPPLIRVVDLSLAYGPTVVLSGVCLSVADGETLAILGQSGCGKTTLLKAIAGLLPSQSGQILLGNRRLTELPLRRRGVVYLDQEPLLLDHLSVLGNVSLAARLKGLGRSEAKSQAATILRAIGLGDHGSKRPWQLSGGQRQRVAFARAILARPQLLLLDEPFGSLDGSTRREMQTQMRKLFLEHQITAVFVTHDLREALTVGDRFCWMRQGAIRHFSDRAAFVADSETGIPEEIQFWTQASRGSDQVT